jgi:hypothetical protein
MRILRSFAAILLLAGIIARARGEDWPYSIQSGDTLIGIGLRYLVDPEDWVEVQERNRVSNPRRLRPGSILLIPLELLKLQPVPAKVVEARGKVEVMRQGAAQWAPIQSGEALRVGDRINTGESSTATLGFADGSGLLLLSNSDLIMKALSALPASEIAATEVRLDKGRVETKVKPLKSRASKYEVETPIVHMGVRGTDFRVSLDPQHPTARAEVLEGEVNAANGLGQVAIPKDFGAVAEENKPPSPPIALLDAPGLKSIASRVERIPVLLRWEASPEAIGYRVQITDDKSFNAILAENVVAATEVKMRDLPDGRYILRVRAIDKNGLEGKNAEGEFEVKARPFPPVLRAPSNKSTARGDKPEFAWTESEEAARYHLQVATDAEFKSLVVDEPSAAKTIIAAQKALPPGDYFWRVASLRASGEAGPFSDPIAFALKPIPMVDTSDIQAPKVEGKALKLRWQAGQPGQKFRVQFARSKNFNPLIKDVALDTSELQMPRPLGKEMFMRLQVIDADGYVAPFGPVQRIELPPLDFTPTFTYDDTQVMLTMPERGENQRLHVQVARTQDFAQPLFDAPVSEPVIRFPRPLGGALYARVKATDADNFSIPYGEVQHIALPSVAAELLPALLQSSSLEFRWVPAPIARAFRVQLALDADFRTLIADKTVQGSAVRVGYPGSGEFFVRVAPIGVDSEQGVFGAPHRIAIPALDARPQWLVLPLTPAAFATR